MYGYNRPPVARRPPGRGGMGAQILRNAQRQYQRQRKQQVFDVPDLHSQMQAAYFDACNHYQMQDVKDPRNIEEYLRQVTEAPWNYNQILEDMMNKLDTFYRKRVYEQSNMMNKQRAWTTAADTARPVRRKTSFRPGSRIEPAVQQPEPESEEEEEEYEEEQDEEYSE